MLIWLYILAIGIAGFVVGGGAGIVIGIVLTALAAFGMATTLRQRVCVDDAAVLYWRGLRGWGTPIRLDQLLRAHLTPLGRNSGPQLYLADATGATACVDATNARLVPLYAELARHIAPGSDVANALLHKRMDRFR